MYLFLSKYNENAENKVPFDILEQSQEYNISKIRNGLYCLRNILRYRNVSQSLHRRRRQMPYDCRNKIFCKWRKSKKKRERFLAEHSLWLYQELILPS